MRLLLLLVCMLLAACSGSRTIEREVGYKGKARLNAYLAAQRFLETYGYTVENNPGWPELKGGVSMLVLPGSVLSTEAYVREVSEWVAQGGHLLCLVSYAESYHDDWGRMSFMPPSVRRDDEMPGPLEKWLASNKLKLSYASGGDIPKAEYLSLQGQSYEVAAESATGVASPSGKPGIFGQAVYGDGLITVMTDARPFRNRYISDHDHAALLLALTRESYPGGKIVFVRDAALSLWALLWRHAWAALLGLLAVTFVWLWKNMPRFGPLRRTEARSTLREYDHHLEALGDFQWRLDKGAAMLRPLRESVLERAQRLSAASQRDVDLFLWIGERAGIGRERAERAMTHERPADGTSFTRVIADLQKIHHSLSS